MNRRIDNRSRGFTLVELLVVIAIIGLLIALLLPAVQAARESARKTQCKNNMKQIALAWHNHHDTFHIFPTGGREYNSTINFGTGPQRVGWPYQILPFIEQEPLSQIQSNEPFNARPGTIGGNGIQTFNCPTRDGDARLNTGRGRCDYAAAIPGFERRPDNIASQFTRNNVDHRGIVTRVPFNVTFADVTDGLAFTVMLAEKWVEPLRYEPGGCSGRGLGWLSGWTPSIIRMTTYPPSHDERPTAGLTPFKQTHMFGSPHISSLVVGMGDASVRFVTYNVDGDIWWRAGMRDDGQTTFLPE
ncbi:MAG: DUF1559 domain-containing protein [Planctomycetes bacterium]|nr:DUF1559 domain-containing protein [Planctomycetota bacterium]